MPLARADRVFGPTLCVSDFLVSGALIVSWGLALATWVPRLGRAVALSVVAFFLIGLAWPLMTDLLFSPLFMGRQYERNRALHEFLMSLSPLAGPMGPITMIQGYESKHRWPSWLAIGMASLIKAGFAGLLFWLTVKSFNRCLGRMADSKARARPRESAVREELIPIATS